jgi:hypothetical protein
MQNDKTYTPLQADFDDVLKTYFPSIVAGEQIKLLQIVFFAGAASSYQLLTTAPEKKETVFAELLDHAEHMEASA